MFKKKPDATFTATVKIPNGDNPLPLKLEFRRKSKADVAAWIDAAASKSDAEGLAEVVAGWHDVVDENGQRIEFTSQAFSEVLDDYSGASMAIFTGYLKALTEAERKN